MGLTVARMLARQHGGELALASRVGGGTVASLEGCHATLVMVVDDDRAVRFTIRSLLEEADLDVVEATDASKHSPCSTSTRAVAD